MSAERRRLESLANIADARVVSARTTLAEAERIAALRPNDIDAAHGVTVARGRLYQIEQRATDARAAIGASTYDPTADGARHRRDTDS